MYIIVSKCVVYIVCSVCLCASLRALPAVRGVLLRAPALRDRSAHAALLGGHAELAPRLQLQFKVGVPENVSILAGNALAVTFWLLTVYFMVFLALFRCFVHFKVDCYGFLITQARSRCFSEV